MGAFPYRHWALGVSFLSLSLTVRDHLQRRLLTPSRFTFYCCLSPWWQGFSISQSFLCTGAKQIPLSLYLMLVDCISGEPSPLFYVSDNGSTFMVRLSGCDQQQIDCFLSVLGAGLVPWCQSDYLFYFCPWLWGFTYLVSFLASQFPANFPFASLLYSKGPFIRHISGAWAQSDSPFCLCP